MIFAELRFVSFDMDRLTAYTMFVGCKILHVWDCFGYDVELFLYCQ